MQRRDAGSACFWLRFRGRACTRVRVNKAGARGGDDGDGSPKKNSVVEPVKPVTRRLLEVHYGKHSDVIGFEHVNGGVLERTPKVSPGLRRTIDAEERGTVLNFCDEFVDVVVKSLAKLGLDGGVVP